MNIRQAIEQRRNICDEDYIMVEKAWKKNDVVNLIRYHMDRNEAGFIQRRSA